MKKDILWRQIAIFGISIDELKGIEARMHAADHIEIQPIMPFQFVPNAPLAI
jgi:hypothetical protein